MGKIREGYPRRHQNLIDWSSCHDSCKNFVKICSFLRFLAQTHTARGVVRNLLRGDREGGLGLSPPEGSRGRASVGVWNEAPRSRRHAEYSTEQSHRWWQIAYCSESDYTLKKFPATTEGHAAMSPWLSHCRPLRKQLSLCRCNYDWVISASIPDLASR